MFTAPPMRWLFWVVTVATMFGSLTPAVGDEQHGYRWVHSLIESGKTDEAIALLAKDSSLIESQDDMHRTPLHIAALHSEPAVVKWLAEHKAKMNAAAYNGFTPLHMAKDKETAKALIKGGADPGVVDAWGNTALQNAAQEKELEVVDAILDSGFKLDLSTAVELKKRDEIRKMLKDDPTLAKKPTKGTDLWGCKTPLAVACAQNDKEIAQLLLDAGAEVNETTYMPNVGGDASALTSAVWAGHAEMVELLLKHGAKTSVTGGVGYGTILDYARKESTPEIVKLLERAGEKAEKR